MDREALATLTGHSQRTIRRHCTPTRREHTRDDTGNLRTRALYDALISAEQLEQITPRRAA